MNFLERYEVYTTISLDGKKDSNDAHRIFVGNPKASVLESVLQRLENVPKKNLGVSLVFNSENVGQLLSNVDFFYRMGFGRITFTPELYELWPVGKKEVMQRVLVGFRKYYRTLLEGNVRPFSIPILFSVLENLPKNKAGERWWHNCHNLTLGPDHHYYACDKALSFEVGTVKEQRMGTIESGFNDATWRKHYDRAIAYIENNGWGADESFCPMGPYFYSEIAKEDPLPRLKNFHDVSNIFAQELLTLIEENKSNSVFRELYSGVLEPV